MTASVRRTALFPGQGSQYVGMGRALLDAYPEARAIYERADAALGFSLSRLSFEGPESELVLTRNTQPAILVHSVAALTVMTARGFVPLAAAGHSLGEYSAYVAAGALLFEDAVRLVRRRGELMYQAGVERPGAMAAVLGLDGPAVLALCAEASAAGIVVPANLNSPGQVVISGEVAGVEKAMELAPAHGAKKVARLPAFVAGGGQDCGRGRRLPACGGQCLDCRKPICGGRQHLGRANRAGGRVSVERERQGGRSQQQGGLAGVR